ncbi:MAG: hypothetical protein ACI8YQ_003839 [Polaribacter sp.]|jgi:hypothetical protein
MVLIQFTAVFFATTGSFFPTTGCALSAKQEYIRKVKIIAFFDMCIQVCNLIKLIQR